MRQNLASRSFDEHGPILIILSKQHQHTFKNDVPIKLPLSIHFCLLYFNNSDGNEAKRNMFAKVGAFLSRRSVDR